MERTDCYKHLTEDSIMAQYIYKENNYYYINPAFAQLFGYQHKEFLHNQISVQDLFDEDACNYIKENGDELARLQQPYQLTATKQDGSVIHVEIHSQLLHDSTAVMGTVIDVTKQVKEKQELELIEQRYDSFFRYNTDMIYSLDLEGNILSMNPALETITGYKPEEVMGQLVTPFIMVEDIPKKLYHFEEAKKGHTAHYEVSIIHKEGKKIDLACSSMPIVINGEIVGVYGIGKDVTEKNRAEKEANYFAYYDTLTNLPNRRLFEDRLSQAFSHAQKNKDNMAVMFLDIDRFKLINDSFGHKTGDDLIQMVAARLKEQIREIDTLSRLGGDEFTVLLADLENKEEAISIANKMIKAVKQPFHLDGKEFMTTASIGISFIGTSENYHNLLQQADLAMYHVKANGRNAYAVYSKTMDTKAAYLFKIENDLRKAIRSEEFELHYQPIVEISNGRTLAVEALLRWNHPQLGMIPPLDFIPIAEETGLIGDIGEWVLRKACQQTKARHDAGAPATQVAVNVSIKQLQQANFYNIVKKILAETGLASEWLILEITESEMMKNYPLIVDTIKKIRDLGIKIYIDDFGTGYSSLSYLKQLPIDCVKIDKSFIQDIGKNNGNAIVKAILALTKQLDLTSVAEGVESQEQLSFLADEICDSAQGYYFSAPLPENPLQCLLIAEKSPNGA